MTLAGHELGWGPGAEPPEVQGFWAINNCQMSMILYLSCDTGRSRICVGSRGGAPEIQGFWAINYCQMSMHFIPYLVTLVGRELAWGPGGGAPGSSGVWAINYCQMSMILYLNCDTGRSRISVGSRADPPEVQGFWAINYCQMSMHFIP